MLLAEEGCNTAAEGFLRGCLSNTIKTVCLIKDGISAEINIYTKNVVVDLVSFCTMMPISNYYIYDPNHKKSPGVFMDYTCSLTCICILIYSNTYINDANGNVMMDY